MTRLRGATLCAALLLAGVRAGAQPAPAASGPDALRSLDLAEGVLETLSSEGIPASALFGVLTPAARQRLVAGAQRAGALADEAAGAIDAAVDALDADPRAGESEELAAQRMALAVEGRELRLPLARARAAVLTGATEADARARAAQAQRALGALRAVTLTGVAIDVRRLTLEGEALLLAGRVGEADDRFAAALARAAQAAGEDAPAPMDVTEAILARALIEGATRSADGALRALRERLGSPPFTQAGRPVPLLHLLAAGAIFRVEAGAAGPGPASEAFMELLARESLRASWPALRAAAFERIETVWDSGSLSPSSATAIALIARAEALARDDSRLDEAVRSLQEVSARESRAGSPALPEALWSLAHALARRASGAGPGPEATPDGVLAVRTLLRLQRDHPRHPAAERAPAAALALARAIRPAAPGSPGAGEATSALRDALRLALRVSPADPETEQRRLELALTLAEGDAERTALLESVGGAGPERARARLLLAVEADRAQRPGRALVMAREAMTAAGASPGALRASDLAELARIEVRALLARDRAEEALAAAQRAGGAGGLGAGPVLDACAALAQRAADAERDGDEEGQRAAGALLARFGRLGVGAHEDGAIRARFLRYEADGLAASGDPAGALAIYGALADPERPTLDLALARAEAFLALGRRQDAFALYRDVAATLEEQDRAAPAYWRAWSRMLEILALENADGARTPTIRVRLNRLRVIDPGLGGEPHRRRMEGVERSLTPSP